jgi:hypothetical protein
VGHGRRHEGGPLGIEQPSHPGDLLLFCNVGRLGCHGTTPSFDPNYEM